MADTAAIIATLWTTYATVAASPSSDWGEGGHRAKMASLKDLRGEIEALEQRQAAESGGGSIFIPITGAYE
jgi:hypothetical protein